ncbi:MAG: sigma-70 family RNA polymerase sigma factor [Opitutaceae bacterium]|nr:sigma-70 family RNA polymerase sigma factor [Opitutaceae bacterium]
MNTLSETEEDNGPSRIAPVLARRIGYSSRGRAAPLGEAEEPPLVLGRPSDPEREERSRSDGLRRSYDTRRQQQERETLAAEKAAAGLAKKTENSRREAEFRTRGQKFYADDFGDLQPEQDESGRPRFQPSAWKKAEVPTTDGGKTFALARRNERGEQEIRRPKLAAPADAKDPQLYHDFGTEGREAIGHVDDLARSPDPEVARIASDHRLKRNAALRTESLKPLRAAYDAASVELKSAQLNQRQFDDQITKLNEQIGQLDTHPEIKKTAGGFIGIGASPTREAQRLQAKRATLQTQRDELSKQSADLRLATGKDGALLRKQEAAKLELDLWGHQSELGELDDLAENRRAFLRTQKRAEKDDPVLAQILTQQEAFGAMASQTAALRQRDDEIAAQGRAAGESAPLDPTQFGTAAETHQQQSAAFAQRLAAFKSAPPDEAAQGEAAALEGERRTLLQDRAKLNAWSGRITAERDKEAVAAISEIQRDRDEFKPDFFVGNWSKLFTGQESTARDERMANLRGEVKTAWQDRSVSALATTEKLLNYVGAIVSTPVDIVRGRTLKDIEAQEKHEQAKQLIGDFKGPEALKVLRLQNEFSARLAAGEQIVPTGRKTTAGETLRHLSSVDSLESLQSLYDTLKQDDGTSPVLGGVVGSRELSKSALQIAALINALPGVNVDFKSLGIDAKTPEAFAQHAVLARAVTEQIRAKYAGSALAGMVSGSLDQFIAMNALAAPVAARAAIAGKRTEFVAQLGGVKTAAERGGLWLASAGVGSAQSYYENPSMTFAGRWVDIIGNTIPLAVGEMAGNRLEKAVTRGLPATLSSGKLALSTGARTAGAWAGEVTSDVVQNLLDGTPFDGQLADSLAGNLGAVLAMGLIRGRAEAIPLKQARDYAQRLTALRAEVGHRVADIRSVLDLSREQTPQGERARQALTALPAGAVENFEQIVDLLPAGAVTHAATPGQLRGQNALRLGRMAFAGSYVEAMQHRLTDTARALTQVDAAPDFALPDPQTGEPLVDPATIGANREAARALVRLGNGTTPDQLTEAETQGLQLVGQQLGTEMLREVAGQPVITDKARAWALDLAPAASRIIRQGEAERTATITTAAAQAAATTATPHPAAGASESDEVPIADDLRSELAAQAPQTILAPKITPEAFPVATPGVTAQTVAGDNPQADSRIAGSEPFSPPAPATLPVPPGAETRADTSDAAESSHAAATAPRLPARATTKPAPAKVPQTQPRPAFQLPPDLRGAKPRFGYGPKQFTVTFESELDKALYVLAQAKPSARDADFLRTVVEQTGMTEAEARTAGAAVRNRIKALARESKPGLLVVPSSDEGREATHNETGPHPTPSVTNIVGSPVATAAPATQSSFTDTRRELLRQIDAASSTAPSEADFEAEAIRVVQKLPGIRPAEKAARIATEARELAVQSNAPGRRQVTIESGRSRYQVTNTKEVLARLRKLVERSVAKPAAPGGKTETASQASVINRFKAATNETERRAAIDLMTERTLRELGLDRQFVRIGPGAVVTREAAEKLRRQRAGENVGEFDVEASTPISPDDHSDESLDTAAEQEPAPTAADRVTTHLEFADRIARQYRIPGLTPDDVQQEARRTLVAAVRGFDPQRGEFAPFAGTVIRNRLRDIFTREVRRVRTQGVSADAADDTGGTLLDKLVADEAVRGSAEQAETKRLLMAAINALPERARAILNARAEGASFSEIAERHGISRQRANELGRNAMAVVRARLAELGVRGFDDGVLASMAGEEGKAAVDPAAPGAFAFTTPTDDQRAREDAEEVRYFETALNEIRGPDAAPVRLALRRLRTDAESGEQPGGAAPAGLVRTHRALEAAFGKRIIFVEPSEPVAWQAATARRRANTIIVSTRADRPFVALVGHELNHQIKNQAPDLYRAFREVVREIAPMPADYAREKAAQGYSPEAVETEWLGDILGTRFDEATFWAEVARVADRRSIARDGSASSLNFRELIDLVTTWLDRLAQRIGNLLHDKTGAAFVQDIERLRRTAAEILVEYQQRGTLPDDPFTPRFEVDNAELSVPRGFTTDAGAPSEIEFATPTNPGEAAAKPDESTRAPAKPAPVPGQPGNFYRSTPDSLRERGLEVARQIYTRRGHTEIASVATEIVDSVGEERAAEIALGRDGNGVPGDVKTLVYGELLSRKARRLTDPKTGKTDRAKAQREIQRLQAEKPAQFTERGQEISALQRVYRDVRAATMSEYLDAVRAGQDRKLGDAGAKAVTEAAGALGEAREKAVEAATKELEKSLRAIPVTKALWQQYREHAADRMIALVDGTAKAPADKAPLQEFTQRVIAEMRSRLAAHLPDKPESEPVEPTAAELIREAVANREKYADVFATVRARFVEEFGEGSAPVDLVDAELANIGARPYSQRLLDRAIKEAHSAMRTNVAELARRHFTRTDAQAAELADALVTLTGLSGDDARQVAADLETRAKELVAEARWKALDKLRSQLDATPRTRAVLDAIGRAKELNNLGALHEADLREIVAQRLNLPSVTAEQMTQLAALADRVETAGSHAARARAELELATGLRDLHGVGRAELATSIFYANLLSGFTTHAANAVGNFTNATLQLASVMAANPRRGGEALRGWVHGFAEGWQDARSILRSGHGRRDFNAKVGTGSDALERIDYARQFPNLTAKIAVGLNKHAAVLRYVFSAMKAVDAVFFHAAREAYTRVAVAKLLEGEFKGRELGDKVKETLKLAPHHFINAERQAAAEGYSGLEKSLRVADIIVEKRRAEKAGAEADTAAERFALEATFSNEPVGWAGVLYRHLAGLTEDFRPGGVPVLKAFLPFLRVPTNVFNTSLNFTPIGAVRAIRGMPEPRLRDGKVAIERREFTDDERMRLYVQSFGSSLAMAAIYALALGAGKDDEEEPWFTITATGPSSFAKQEQLRATGWRPHSMKFGDAWVSYKDSPLLVPLAVVGNAVDAHRYQKTRDDLAFGSRAIDSAMRGSRALFDTSMLSGLGTMMDFVQDRASANRVGQFLTRIAADLAVPYSNLLRQIDRAFSPEMHNPDGPLGDLGAALPFVRNTGSTRPDVLGEAVKSSSLDRFVTFETNDAVRELLRSKNVFVPTPNRDTKIGDQVMTPVQYHEFLRLRGERLRRELEIRVVMMRPMKREQVERIVDRLAREATEDAKIRMRHAGLVAARP